MLHIPPELFGITLVDDRGEAIRLIRKKLDQGEPSVAFAIAEMLLSGAALLLRGRTAIT